MDAYNQQSYEKYHEYQDNVYSGSYINRSSSEEASWADQQFDASAYSSSDVTGDASEFLYSPGGGAPPPPPQQQYYTPAPFSHYAPPPATSRAQAYDTAAYYNPAPAAHHRQQPVLAQQRDTRSPSYSPMSSPEKFEKPERKYHKYTPVVKSAPLRDNKIRNSSKPSGWSFPNLVAYALKKSETGELAVNEIYDIITDRFPYFRTAAPTWKNSVRHNLSLNKNFQKKEVTVGSDFGRKRCLWSIRPDKMAKVDKDLRKALDKERAAGGAPAQEADEDLFTRRRCSSISSSIASSSMSNSVSPPPFAPAKYSRYAPASAFTSAASTSSSASAAPKYPVRATVKSEYGYLPKAQLAQQQPRLSTVHIKKEVQDSQSVPRPVANNNIARFRPAILQRKRPISAVSTPSATDASASTSSTYWKAARPEDYQPDYSTPRHPLDPSSISLGGGDYNEDQARPQSPTLSSLNRAQAYGSPAKSRNLFEMISPSRDRRDAPCYSEVFGYGAL